MIRNSFVARAAGPWRNDKYFTGWQPVPRSLFRHDVGQWRWVQELFKGRIKKLLEKL